MFYCNGEFIALLADIRLGQKCKPVINSLNDRAKPDFTIIEVLQRLLDCFHTIKKLFLLSGR